MTELDDTRDILLAEDDLDDVEIFEMALQELDFPYIMRHAANGDILFILLKERLPYILFLDIRMPCKDGIACITEIRKNRDYDQLPVIMYTSQQSKKVVDHCFRSGANLYLEKTHTIRELTEKLRKIFAIDWKNYLHYPPQNQFIMT
ncbi:CheY-like chemotaxis protein [Anseongella ginsenosidimutans]|uniref:CheY-like chemotaxis protein n=1 Tax=Anseongella ginsenosidimutans TaxID=496056 RepID=A0A4R3KUC7_9SPHI|nr:response regulator [Anseongella ginsenosidimutans]QEC52998.1 response regulator [Anseongella ginsenosidimutans]TCS87405.1 CheY-like chemotaxis protein [Anseongella ginsenosidimutans]